MAITHTYSIVNLERDAATGVVSKVLWKLTSRNELEKVTAHRDEFEVTGSASDPGFIPWNDLTEADVLTWVNNNVDKSSIEASVEASLDAPQTGTVTGLPW
tara:strand:- start:233 stop:535 length:303 start_codon:yes stop_codon:yes gene_type:complete